MAAVGQKRSFTNRLKRTFYNLFIPASSTIHPMANNANQHFVHKGYLRPFCTYEGSGAIGLFNVSRQEYKPTASLKGQCSKRYFYGKNPTFEKQMQNIEGTYNTVVRRISTPEYCLNDTDRNFLLRFWLFQYCRTESKAKEGVELGEVLADIADVPPEENDFDQEKAIETALGSFLLYRNQLDDLKVRLVKNKTNHVFVTSDNPAIECNRWYQHDPRPRRRNFGGGLGSSGIILMLPLTPKIIFLAFDGDVYSMPHKNHWCVANKVGDVSAFNQQQHLNCYKNIYCVNELNSRIARRVSEATKSARSAERYAVEFMVAENDSLSNGPVVAILEDGTKLVHASEEEAREIGMAMFRNRRIYPTPLDWPKILKMRTSGSVYSNGSYGGYRRKLHAELEQTKEPDLVFWREPSNHSKLK